MNDMISVIVPVYKVEDYLDKCIDSIVNQTYRNLEIILVDDGSPDNCPAMCDAWAEKDSRIKVIHIKNGGAGKARNQALDIAQGNFIAFVDSDDYISPDMYERMLQNFDDEIDIVECNYILSSSSNEKFSLSNENNKIVYSEKDAMKAHIQDQCFKQIIWNKLYRKKIVKGIFFPEGKLIDDEFWTYRVIGKANKLIRINDCLYCYRQQPDSVMHLSFSLNRLQAIDAKIERLKYIKQYHPDLYFDAHKNLWLTCLYLGQLSLKHLSEVDAKQAFALISKALKEFPLSFSEINKMPLSIRIWGFLSNVSLSATCKMRNIFNIGL